MWQWFKKQTTTAKGLIIICILLVIGIIIRWDHVSKGISEAFGGLFRRPQQEQTTPATEPVIPQNDENTDN